MKVLPELLKSVEFGGGGPKAFGIVMKISSKLSNDDFESRVSPVVIRLFANPDRAIRVSLLDSLPLMIDRFTPRIVNDKIFPQVVGGFTDLAPIVREQTLKSVLVFVPKLSDRTINGELLRHLAKTANDEQPGIRTNTTICLGKIAKSLGTSSRSKVLIAAFTRSLRDPFVHARNASLQALAATAEYFSPEDITSRILPAICTVLLDKEKVVRDQATKTMDIFMQRIRKAAAEMPDSALPPAATSSEANGGARMSTPQPDHQQSAASLTSSWAGWAISSFTNKMSAAAGEMQSGSAAETSAPSPTQQQPSHPTTSRPNMLSTASASNLHRQAVQSPSASRPLSRNSSSSNTGGGGNGFFADAADDAADDGADDDAWGAMDDGFGDDDGGDTWGDNDEVNQADPFKPRKTTTTTTTTTTIMTTAASNRSVSGTGGVQPFGNDDAEPDFAGWLAAQEAKKKGSIAGGSKALPKGLAKTGTASTPLAKRPAAKPVAKPAAKPAAAKPAAKKISLAPKNNDDDDGWGDGW